MCFLNAHGLIGGISRRRLSETCGTLVNDDDVAVSVNDNAQEAPEAPPAIPDGIKVWHDSPTATVDICFVHGLTGDWDSTWTSTPGSQPWPKQFLPSTFKNSRILTFGYGAYVAKKSTPSTARLMDHGANFLSDLVSNRLVNNATSRPIILVAHSLGGLVCKEAILQSRDNPDHHLCDLFKSLRGVIFLGTPHRGSWISSWARLPTRVPGIFKSANKLLLESIGTKSENLASLQIRFWTMMREQREAGRDLKVTCFYEEIGLPGVGVVVSRESATLEGYKALSIHGNHSTMVKFQSRDDNGYNRIVGELAQMQWMSSSKSSTIILSESLCSTTSDSFTLPRQDARSSTSYSSTSMASEGLADTFSG
ncbi:Alpha/Beta hydrolase protein [Cladorrhinum samala]|uniref:Alpha/Beta hydrolase protein n=1 Tax=Cladorrhinum samala TaxID=585594 RepID=A0AAV9HYL7_9PEZI|nr:Alpha/Beta hydrolase protein [Cladorrhinum samala]